VADSEADVKELEKLFVLMPAMGSLNDYFWKRLMDPLEAGLRVAMKSRNIEMFAEVDCIFVPEWFLLAVRAVGRGRTDLYGRPLTSWGQETFGAQLRFMANRQNDPVLVSFGLRGADDGSGSSG
jgi:hypothetical protein